MVSRRADDAGAQLWWAGSTPEQEPQPPLERALHNDAIWQKKAGQSGAGAKYQQQQGAMPAPLQAVVRAPSPFDAGAFARGRTAVASPQSKRRSLSPVARCAAISRSRQRQELLQLGHGQTVCKLRQRLRLFPRVVYKASSPPCAAAHSAPSPSTGGASRTATHRFATDWRAYSAHHSAFVALQPE
jgi:hypothetical protein